MKTFDMPDANNSGAATPSPEGSYILPDKADGWLACVSFVLGFLFIRWVFFSWQGWGVLLFTALFIAVVLLYLRHKGKTLKGEAWFWLAVLLLTALGFSLWQGYGVLPWRALLLFVGAIYWLRIATGQTLTGETSDWLPLDLLQGVIVVPLTNFFAQYRSLALYYRSWRRERVSRAPGRILSVTLGLLLAAALIAFVGPLLLRADAGGFNALLRFIGLQLRWLEVDPLLLVQMLLSIPVAAYIFGLLSGSVPGRLSEAHNTAKAESLINSLRFLPAATVLTTLAALNGVYLVFIFSQLPHFFLAFRGVIPPGWESYAEFARRGFFELCTVAVINLVVLAGAQLGIEMLNKKIKIFRALNGLLALLTLLLIAAAFSRLTLYVGIFGMTVQRLLPGVFLLYLAVVFSAVLLRQYKRFSIMRLAAFVGVTLLCLLCVINTDTLVVNYNANRYLDGTLKEFDTVLLYRAGAAALPAALLLYEQSDREDLRTDILRYLEILEEKAWEDAGTPRDTLEGLLARRRLTEEMR